MENNELREAKEGDDEWTAKYKGVKGYTCCNLKDLQ